MTNDFDEFMAVVREIAATDLQQVERGCDPLDVLVEGALMAAAYAFAQYANVREMRRARDVRVGVSVESVA
jgi:hypothetical protein